MTVEVEGSAAGADSPLQLDGTAAAAAAAQAPSAADGAAKALLKRLDGRAAKEGEGPLLKLVAYGLMGVRRRTINLKSTGLTQNLGQL